MGLVATRFFGGFATDSSISRSLSMQSLAFMPWSRWRYVNSGGYLCPIPLLQEILAGANGDDQLFVTLKYLSEWNKDEKYIRRDKCEVFQTLGHTVQEWAPWDVTFEKLSDGRIRNKETGTTPVFFHGNGGDPKLLAWMDDHLKGVA